MPELPEVETIRRDLEATLVGARVEALWTSGKPMRLNRPMPARRIKTASVGRRIEALRRRAKYLLLDLEGGHSVVVHLGMTGRLLLHAADDARAPHTHVVWRLDAGRELRFVDPRRFGLIELVAKGREEALPELDVLGVDPLGPEFTDERFYEIAHKAKRDVKTFLLDQHRVAGIGNIYASEALYHARIHPNVRANRLSRGRVVTLREAIVTVLDAAVRNRGTSFSDYVDARGEQGQNQFVLRVYGREGEPCARRDGGTIRRIVSQARSTFYCPTCQRP